MALQLEKSWSAKNEVLKVNAHPEQRYNEAVVVGSDRTSNEIVAMAFGYSPEGVHRRALLIAAAPAIAAAAKDALDHLENHENMPGEKLIVADKVRAALALVGEAQS